MSNGKGSGERKGLVWWDSLHDHGHPPKKHRSTEHHYKKDSLHPEHRVAFLGFLVGFFLGELLLILLAEGLVTDWRIFVMVGVIVGFVSSIVVYIFWFLTHDFLVSTLVKDLLEVSVIIGIVMAGLIIWYNAPESAGLPTLVQCKMPVGFRCIDAQIRPQGVHPSMNFEIKNQQGSEVRLLDFKIFEESANPLISCQSDGLIHLDNNEQRVLSLPCSRGEEGKNLSVGRTYSFSIEYSYQLSDRSLVHTGSGSLIARVE